MKKRIFIAGHNGMVGSAISRKLTDSGNLEIVTANKSDVDLTCQQDVNNFFGANPIDEVYLAAARVGGIFANDKYPADFIYDNLMIECNVINAAKKAGIKKLLFLGSSCIYPKLAAQPMSESALLTGKLEPTNEPYALAKIAGIKLCESYNRQYGCDFRSVMPTNLYGPGDNFHHQNSHVIPALIRRFHEAKINKLKNVDVWGTGNAKREFLFVDDLADASIFVMNLPEESYKSAVEPMNSHINIGTGMEHSIQQLTNIIAGVVKFEGDIEFDRSKPDGAPRKLLDISKISNLGWRPKTGLKDGLDSTYAWFLSQEQKIRK